MLRRLSLELLASAIFFAALGTVQTLSMNRTAVITAVAFVSMLLSACSIDKELAKARAEGACEEWSSQAPDWSMFNTGYADLPRSRGWRMTSRRICGSDSDKPDDVVGREFTQEFINAPCHHGDDCTTDLRGVMPEVKRWNGEDWPFSLSNPGSDN